MSYENAPKARERRSHFEPSYTYEIAIRERYWQAVIHSNISIKEIEEAIQWASRSGQLS